MGNSGEEQPKRRSVAGVACVYVTPAELPGVAWSADGQHGASSRAVGPHHGLWGCAIARSVRVRHTGRGAGCGVEC